PFVRLPHGGDVGVAVGDVELQGQEPLPVGRDEIVQRGEITSSSGHRVATLQRGDRPLPPEAAGGTGDEPDLLCHATDVTTAPPGTGAGTPRSPPRPRSSRPSRRPPPACRARPACRW